MRATHSWLGLLLVVAGACGDAAEPEPRAENDARSKPSGDREGDGPVSRPGPSAGGATGDFSGDCPCDADVRELELDQPDDVLGFAAQDVLERIEGEYVVPMVWGDNCDDAPADRPGCDSALPDFAGTTTEVRIAISSPATAARVEECNRGDAYCHMTYLRLPIEGTLRSADGLLDEAFEQDLIADGIDEIAIGEHRETSDAGGTLDDRMSEFAGIEWSFGVSETQAIFEVFVLVQRGQYAHGRLVTRAPEGVAMPDGHGWGVAVDLDDARQ